MYTLAPGAVGHIISVRKNNQDYYYHYDPIGNVQFITDSNGNKVAEYVQEGFGNVLAASGSLTSDFWHLSSKQLEPETALYYFYARWYDPVVGRFIKKDCIPNINLYWFASDNPLFYIDPSGEFIVVPMPLPKPPKDNCLERARAIRDILRRQYPSSGEDPYINFMRHCVGSCMLADQVDSTCAFLAGWWNEFTGSFDWDDVAANAAGRECARCSNDDCYTCCKKKAPSSGGGW